MLILFHLCKCVFTKMFIVFIASSVIIHNKRVFGFIHFWWCLSAKWCGCECGCRSIGARITKSLLFILVKTTFSSFIFTLLWSERWIPFNLISAGTRQGFYYCQMCLWQWRTSLSPYQISFIFQHYRCVLALNRTVNMNMLHTRA